MNDKKDVLGIPKNILTIILLVGIIAGWGASWGILQFQVSDTRNDLNQHITRAEQKFAILEAERKNLLEKLQSIEIKVEKVLTKIEDLER